MNFTKNMMTKPGLLTKLGAVSAAAVLSLTLAACGTSDPVEDPAPTVTETVEPTVAPEPTASESAEPEATDAPTESPEATQTPASERKVVINVEGAKSSALVKTLVVTNDGKEEGGKMNTETLPFTKELTVGADKPFTKILVIAKYKDGQTGNISCTVEIDGEEAAANSSNTHQPAECLIIEKN